MANASSPSSNGSRAWVSGLICGLAFTFVPAPMLLLGILLLPAILSLLLERNRFRPVTRGVALMGIGFTIGPVWHVLMAGSSFSALLEQVSDPLVLAAAWLGGAAGWALCEILPILLNVGAEIRANKIITRLRADLKTEEDEWGLGE